MRKPIKVNNALSAALGYNPYRDTEGQFDDGPTLLASRGRPKTGSADQRKKIDEAKERLRKQFAIEDTKPEREKVLEGPQYIETAGFAINESNLSDTDVRTILWRDKELFPGKTYGDYYATEKAKKGDIFMMTPAEYRQALIESGQYKDIEGIERRMDWDKVDQYTEDMQSGDKFPPGQLIYDEEGKTDQEGLHRIYAAERIGIEKVPVVVISDTRNQDIYPYQKLEGSILTQEELLGGGSYGDDSDDDDKDEHGFDKKGELSGANIMSEAQAKKAIKNSAYKEILYHGTNAISGQAIANEGFNPSSGETQWFGDGVYLTPNGIDAWVYGAATGTPDNPIVVASSYIDVETFFDDDIAYWDMVRGTMVDRGLIKDKNEELKTFEQFDGFNTAARETTQKLLNDYEGVKIPNDSETRDAYVIVRDPASIKTYSIAEGRMAKEKYFQRFDNSVKVKTANQISSRDFPDLYKDIDIDTEELGCIMLDLEPMEVLKYVEDGQDDLFENPKWDQGSVPAETVPHVTLLYGLLENGNVWKKKVDTLLKDWDIKTVKIEEVGFFDTPDSYAVVAHLEKTDKLVDGHERLTLLPHINTFSEYKPHMTLAYVKKEADVNKWVKTLGKQYNGKTVKASGINYGDKPEDGKKKNNSLPVAYKLTEPIDAPTSPTQASLSSLGQEHNSVSPTGLIIAYNALDNETRDIIKSQENALRRGFEELERRIIAAATERVAKNYLEDASDLVTVSERKRFVQDAQALLNTFYINLYPLFGRQLQAQRAIEYGFVGAYQMTEQTQSYIEEMATKAAISHVNTVIQDLLIASSVVYAALVTTALVGLVLAALASGNVRIKKKLLDNGYKETEDQVKQAVEAGVFKDTPMYAEARKLAREGEGQAKIVQTIQSKYRDISENRATTIARTESARVFNQSQFEADKQFLNDSGLMERAYKKLRNRAGDPCDHCKLLVDMPPIPFMTNFADLGSTLRAIETKEDGTVKVKTLPVNWEAISAGNVHPNCRCEYVLIIKDN